MSDVTEHAPAKLNLHLHVTGRRPDGYHLLDSLVVFAEVGDDIVVSDAADGLTLAVTGPFAASLRGTEAGDNLVMRAAAALRAAHGVARGARIELCKNLPVASGIGGGSADAAATLRALRRLWRIEAPVAPTLALGLGADVPVCLGGVPVRMGGIGEVLAPAPRFPTLHLVLANPGVGVSTPSVFRARAGEFRAPAALPASWPDAGAMARDLAALQNDLEAPAIALEPRIGTVLETLRASDGCLLARMSGSGGTCLAMFATAADAVRAASTCRDRGWWSWAGKSCCNASIR